MITVFGKGAEMMFIAKIVRVLWKSSEVSKADLIYCVLCNQKLLCDMIGAEADFRLRLANGWASGGMCPDDIKEDVRAIHDLWNRAMEELLTESETKTVTTAEIYRELSALIERFNSHEPDESEERWLLKGMVNTATYNDVGKDLVDDVCVRLNFPQYFQIDEMDESILEREVNAALTRIRRRSDDGFDPMVPVHQKFIQYAQQRLGELRTQDLDL